MFHWDKSPVLKKHSLRLLTMCTMLHGNSGNLNTCKWNDQVQIVNAKRYSSAPYQTVVINCCRGEPRKSSLIRCSRTQITAPTTRKDNPVTHHIPNVNGCKNAQEFVICFLTGAKITRPDSIKGWVKSRVWVLFIVMTMSPIAASNSCRIS